MEEKYTIEQVVDAITQAGEAVLVAIKHEDWEMLEDVLRDFLN